MVLHRSAVRSVTLACLAFLLFTSCQDGGSGSNAGRASDDTKPLDESERREPGPADAEAEETNAGESDRGGAGSQERFSDTEGGEGENRPRRIELGRTENGSSSGEEGASLLADPASLSFLPASGLPAIHTPFDMEIGRLSTPLAGSEAERLVFNAAEDLLSAMLEGNLAEALDRASLLSRLRLEEALAAAPVPERVRVGEPEAESDSTLRARLRFFSGTRSVSGELFLERSENEWYIQDVQVDLRELQSDQGEDPSEAPFEPGGFDWSLGGP